VNALYAMKCEQFARALSSLERALLSEPNDIEVDGAIQRFECCFELAWKLLKSRLEEDGLRNTASPRAAFSAGLVAGYLSEELSWLTQMEDRNRSVHTYYETMSREIFSRLPLHYAAMSDLLKRLQPD
jgi:nucleotidyltransferase substrate binding protein (TIGR01987 family)